MVVLSLVNVPPALRGDMTKWLQEISTGVYVGRVSARVRDELRERVVKNAGKGTAVMVYNARNEQGLDFRVHQTGWRPIDFDGLKLMLKPAPQKAAVADVSKRSRSKAEAYIQARKYQRRKPQQSLTDSFAAIDVETTGFSSAGDDIIEIAAVHIDSGKLTRRFCRLINTDKPVPDAVKRMTGITDELLARDGIPLREAIEKFIEFVGDRHVLCHNAAFDYGFIRSACVKLDIEPFSNAYTDTYALSRRSLDDVDDFKLRTLLAYFGIQSTGAHRALPDSISTAEVYLKLIDFSNMDG